jgi:hypothetical protein
MDLASYLDKAERGDPGATVTQLMADLASGKVKHEDVFAHYKATNMKRLNEAVSLFGQGRLFAAQTQDFPAWLRGEQWHKDAKVALEFRAVEDLCGVKVQDVDDFIGYMVQPSPGARKHDSERMGESDYQRVWGARTVKRSWRW